jgi:hypothetical protein
MESFSSFRFAFLLWASALILSACDAPPASVPRQGGERVPQAVPQAAPAEGLKQRQMAFLNRLREADPQGHTIDRALLNEQNELGLILDRSVEMEKIPALMRTMLTQMAREFPGENLTVIAYAPSTPPRKIGTARLNAGTRDMTYAAEKPIGP